MKEELPACSLLTCQNTAAPSSQAVPRHVELLRLLLLKGTYTFASIFQSMTLLRGSMQSPSLPSLRPVTLTGSKLDQLAPALGSL